MNRMRSSDRRKFITCFYISTPSDDDRNWPDCCTPLIAITMGDPGGIGPEVALKAICDPRVRAAVLPVVLGDPGLAKSTAGRLGLPIDFTTSGGRGRIARRVIFARVRRGRGEPCENFMIIGPSAQRRAAPVGKPSRLGGQAAGRAVEEAVKIATSNVWGGMVTAPVSKQSLALAGYGMIGHTELIAKLTETRHYAMMMKNGPLCVVLATTHVPLVRVASRLTSRDLAEKIKLTHEYLTRYTQLRQPLIAVCGLNPHAGEGGMLGKEERSLIAPAVRRSRQRGIRAEGPLSADSVFRPDHIGRYNAVVAMYHDQGIIPIKMGDPGGVINVTLGLPIVRTSPGHGTAFDIAGKGVASAESMVEAILECGRMVKRRRRLALEAAIGCAGG